jgi:type VI secretion system protein ImpE
VIAPLSWKHSDEAVRLGRATVWEEDPQHGDIPLGQKLLLRGEDEEPFLDLRKLTFHRQGEKAESATS